MSTTTGLDAGQIVAQNLSNARHLRGFTQTEIAARLTHYSHRPWTKTAVAIAEGSVRNVRQRAFTTNELFALALSFDVPVTYFLTPRCDPATGVAVVGITDWEQFSQVAFGADLGCDPMTSASDCLEAARLAIVGASTDVEGVRG